MPITAAVIPSGAMVLERNVVDRVAQARVSRRGAVDDAVVVQQPMSRE